MKAKPTKSDRSGAKWLPGAMALATTPAGAQAATVQITLTGNKITNVAGATFNPDLTDDGTPDVNLGVVWLVGTGLFAVVNGGTVWASRDDYGRFVGTAAFVGGGDGRDSPFVSTLYLNPISFTDSRINGGVETAAWLEVHASNTSVTDHTIEFTRLIFDDASTTRPSFGSIPGVQTEWSPVPEPSGFAATSLLLGAAGLIRRRQARAA